MIELLVSIEAYRQDGAIVISHPVTKSSILANEDEEKLADLIYQHIKKAFNEINEKLGGLPYHENMSIDD